MTLPPAVLFRYISHRQTELSLSRSDPGRGAVTEPLPINVLTISLSVRNIWDCQYIHSQYVCIACIYVYT